MCQAPSLRRTASLTARPSADLPVSIGITAFITLPMSFGEEAPVSAMAAATVRQSPRTGRRRRYPLASISLAPCRRVPRAPPSKLLDRIRRCFTMTADMQTRRPRVARSFSTPFFMMLPELRSADRPPVLRFHRAVMSCSPCRWAHGIIALTGVAVRICQPSVSS